MKVAKQSKKVFRGRVAGILIEDLDSKLDLIVEKVGASEKHLSEKMDEMKAELKQEIADIKFIVRHHSEKMQEHDRDILFLKQASRH